MKKLAFIATGYIRQYDGISVYTENLLKEFLLTDIVKNKKIMIDIYTGKDVKELLQKRVMINHDMSNINFIAVSDTSFLKKILSLNIKLIRPGKYDFVFMTNFMPILFIPSKTMKVIHDFSVNLYPELFPPLYKVYHDFLLRYAKYFDTAIAYISNTTRKDLETFHPINENNKTLVYLPNGIPFKVRQYQRPDDASIDKKFSSRTLEFLVVGRINNHKGFDRILEFCRYYDKGLENNEQFETVNFNIAGKQTPETKALFADLHLKNINLIFHGFVDDSKLNQLFTQSHFCFFLSRNEGYGLPLVEAMWFKSFPIISNIPIFNEIMGSDFPKFDQETGYTSKIETYINNCFNDISYRKSLQKTLEEIVTNEEFAYRNSAKTLSDFILKKEENNA